MICAECDGKGRVVTDNETYDCPQCEGIPATREERLDDLIRARLEWVCDEASRTEFTYWWEIRESIVRVLFEMDSEQVIQDFRAKLTRDNCM